MAPPPRSTARPRRDRATGREEKRQLDAVGELAAAIAHEMRSPIVGISSAVQLLRFRSRDDPVVERNVGRILREVEKLNTMLSELLDYGRPRPLVLDLGDPSVVWDRVIEGNRGLLESGALQLERKRDDHVRLPIDAERLGQAFLAVLVHAIERAPAGSTLTLSSHAPPNGSWHCTLRHEGSILSEEEIARSFDVLHSSRKTGRSIALALSRRILDQHGGDIALDSTGEGTTISMSLPAGR